MMATRVEYVIGLTFGSVTALSIHVDDRNFNVQTPSAP